MMATGESTSAMATPPALVTMPEAEQPLADEAAQVLDAIERLMAKGKEVENDIRDADSAGLAPGRTLRLRKKSKDLQDQVIALLEPKLERVFKSFDVDSSGELDQKELKAAFEAAGRPVSDSMIAKAMAAIDTDGSGTIDLNEFKALAYKTGTMPSSPLKLRNQ